MNSLLKRFIGLEKRNQNTLNSEKEFYLSCFKLFFLFQILILIIFVSLSHSDEIKNIRGSQRVPKSYSGEISEELKRRSVGRDVTSTLGDISNSVKYSRPEYPLKVVRASVSVSHSYESLDLYSTQYMDIWTDESYGNHCDPDNILVDAILTSPKGNELVIPAFYKSGNSGNSHWEIRFTPREVGTYSYHIEIVKDGWKSNSETKSFGVTNSEKDGFLHVDKENYYSLQFDSKKRFRGVGQNFGWEDKGYTYDNMFPKMANNGINFFRTWMCPFNNMLEWGSNGPTNYNLNSAENWDNILRQAEENGIYIMLTLDYHGVFVTQPDYWGGNNYWKENPYSTDNGGMCWSPAEFFSNSDARKAYKKRLRYIIARWGYSSSLAVIELFNEIDHAINNENVNVSDVVSWHDEMGSYIKSIDPYGHIVSTSVSHEYYPDLWNVSSIDISQRHLYGSGGSHVTDNFYNEIKSWNDSYGKPFVAGEFGYDWKSPAEINDNASFTRELKLGLWRGMFSPTPILPMTWWWDFHEPWGDFVLYKAAGDFNNEFLSVATDEIKEISASTNNEVEIMALSAGDIYALWMRNRMDYFWGEGEVTLSNVENGTYSVSYHNPNTGEVEEADDINVNGGTLKLTRPALQADEDIACIVKLKVDPVTLVNKKQVKFNFKIVSTTKKGRVKIKTSYGGNVEVFLYSCNGRKISHIIKELLSPGIHDIKLTDKKLAKQMYLVQLKTPDGNLISKKMLWNK